LPDVDFSQFAREDEEPQSQDSFGSDLKWE
jgi:hypothetical protein